MGLHPPRRAQLESGLLVPRPMMLPGFRMEPQPTSTLSPRLVSADFLRPVSTLPSSAISQVYRIYVGGDGTGTMWDL